jgi:carotenoid cleavage dioxygenase-like enzyme
MNLKSFNYYTGDSILSTFDYSPEGLTTFYVISKKENKHIATFTTSASFGLHIINAYETNQTIWIDFSIYDDDKIVQDLTTENLRDATKLSLPSSKIIRFRLDLNEIENAGENPNNETNATFQASFDHFTKDISIELPTINQKFLGRNYKYAYGVALPFTDPTPGKFYDRIKKIDVENKQYISWSEPHCYPSQPIFIQDPSRVDDEDGGVVLSTVYDGSKDESFVIILNAKDMTEITRIPLPVPVSPSFSHATAKAN